jgi:hypothetical protein
LRPISGLAQELRVDFDVCYVGGDLRSTFRVGARWAKDMADRPAEVEKTDAIIIIKTRNKIKIDSEELD